MSTRGSVVVECDSPNCHAEQEYTAKQLCCGLRALLRMDWWGTSADGTKDLCPACVEEAQEP